MSEAPETQLPQPLCRSDWYTDTDHHRQGPTDRVIRCNLAAGHDGDHDEMVDGEPGVVTWSRRPRQPEVRAMPTQFPAHVQEITDRHGCRYWRDPNGGPYWRRGEPEAWSWREGELLLNRGPLTEVIPTEVEQ